MNKAKSQQIFRVRSFGSQVTVTWPGARHAEAGFSRLDPKIKSMTLITRQLGEELMKNRALLYRIKEVCGVEYIKVLQSVTDGSYFLSNVEPTYDLNELLDTIADLKAQVAEQAKIIAEQNSTIESQSQMLAELTSGTGIHMARPRQPQPNSSLPAARITFD